MNHEVEMPVKKLYKEPRQKRAKQMVQKILQTTKSILESEGLDHLTTNTAAEKGGIAVGTVYRYFPNKQALLLAIYGDLLDNILDTCDNFATEEKLTLPKETFFEQLFWELKSAERSASIISELDKAGHLYPELQELEVERVSFEPATIWNRKTDTEYTDYQKLSVHRHFSSADLNDIDLDGKQFLVMDLDYLFVTPELKKALETTKLNLKFGEGFSKFG